MIGIDIETDDMESTLFQTAAGGGCFDAAQELKTELLCGVPHFSDAARRFVIRQRNGAVTLLCGEGAKLAGRVDAVGIQGMQMQICIFHFAASEQYVGLTAGDCIAEGKTTVLKEGHLPLRVYFCLELKTGKLDMPKNVRRFTQMLSGALIGTSVTMESTHRLAGVIVPALLICCGFVVIIIILAVVLHKVCKLDFATAMLSSSAGGATEAALTALDFNADPSVVSVLQITRMVCTTSFYPILVQLLYLYV